jgi:hypothetical protein
LPSRSRSSAKGFDRDAELTYGAEGLPTVPGRPLELGVLADSRRLGIGFFGTLEAMDVRRLKAVEQENARLKKLLAERDLEIEVLKEITQGKY